MIESNATVCSFCNLRELCYPCGSLSPLENEVADSPLADRASVRCGETLYRSGDRFAFLYVVRDGFFKSTALLENGSDQVTGFSIRGDILGLDGIEQERHMCNVIALVDSDVCAIAFKKLEELTPKLPSLRHQLHKMMSGEIIRERGVILLLGSMNAEERLTMFLCDLSQRLAARGYSRSEITLRMTRQEIGSYLGLTIATVSRTFSKLQERGLIDVKQKFIYILDGASLKSMLSGVDSR